MYDFPNTPTIGQAISFPDGTMRTWNGIKWVSATGGMINQFVPLSGGTMSGPLVLNANPSAALGISTKQYVDAYSSSVTSPDIGRNKVHNSLFNIWQRGTLINPATNGGLTADRWISYNVGDSVQVQRVSPTDSDRTTIGDEEMTYALAYTWTASTGLNAYNLLAHHIEQVERLSNKTIVVSFYANVGASLNVGISIDIYFGSGGSNSTLGNGVAVALTAGWKRYSVALNVPSVAGQTIGPNNDDYTGINFWFSSGTNNNARAGNIGVQGAASSTTINLWGMQVEISPTGQATRLEKLDPRVDLANCQRFYQTGRGHISGYTSASGQSHVGSFIAFNNTMRATPYATVSGGTVTGNGTGLTISGSYPNGIRVYCLSTGAAGIIFWDNFLFTASADI